MSNNISLNDTFANNLLDKASKEPFSTPLVFFNHDGDCIEVLVSENSYRAERLDSLVTVYINRENGQLVGALVKGVRSFIRKMVERVPGFMIEIRDGKIKLEYLFTAGLWSHDSGANKVLVQTYNRLRQMAEDAHIEIDMGEMQEA